MLTPSAGEKLRQALPVIMGRTRSLALTLSQFIAADEFPLIDRTFAWVFENGGDCELGFSRLAGTSYNPRLARVVEILLRDGGARDGNSILAALICCCRTELDLPLWIPDEVRCLRKEARTVLRSEGGEVSRSGELVGLALAIDALRHLHLAVDERELREEFALAVDGRLLSEYLFTERLPAYLERSREAKAYQNYFRGWGRRHVRA